jgi:hypothetical protein
VGTDFHMETQTDIAFRALPNPVEQSCLAVWLIMLTSGLTFMCDAGAATIPTSGSNSAVTSVDRAATFSAITNSGIALSDYVEGNLFIGANADSLLGYDPFGGANGSDPYFYCLDSGSFGGGADAWVTIRTTDSKRIFGVEFLYGNSWTTGSGWGNNNAWVTWETLRGSSIVSSNQIGPNPTLLVGTVIGFYDPEGFDELRVKCNAPNQADPAVQALALDNLHVQLTTNLPPAPVIYGSDLSVDPATSVPALTVYDTIVGCQYRMLYAEGLTSPSWTPVPAAQPDGWKAGGGTLTFSDTGAPGRPHRFYKVQAF